MPEVKFIDYHGKQILLMDFAGLADMDLLSKLVDESIQLVQAVNAHRSVLALIDLSNIRMNRDVITSLKRLSRNNGPFIKAIAFIGFGPMARMLVSIMLRVTKRRNHRVMPVRSQALDWLVRQ
jgi:hypothetical protein